MSGCIAASPTVSELAGLALRAGAPLFVAALAVVVTSIVLAAWTGILDPAATWLLRTAFVGAALVTGATELWLVGTILFERCLALDDRSIDHEDERGFANVRPAARAGSVGRVVDGGSDHDVAAATPPARPTARADAEAR